MLENMGGTSVVCWVCLETNGEDAILVISCDVNVICSRFVVSELDSCQLQLGNELRPLNSEAMEPVASFRKPTEVCGN